MSSQNLKTHSTVYSNLIFILFFTDTDTENAFEARDLESDFHDDVSTTRGPTTPSHGMYRETYPMKENLFKKLE